MASNDKLSAVTHGELMRFLDMTGRSTQCSACHQQDKGWLFHVETSPDGHTPDPAMTVFVMPANVFQPNETQVLPVLCIECPQCGHLELLNAIRTRERLDEQKEGSHG